MLTRAIPWAGHELRDAALVVRAGASLVALLLVLVVGAQTWDWQPDTALVHARYVDNLLDGHGLVFNSGEDHNVLPGFLGVLATAGPTLAGADAADAAQAISLAAIAATALLFAWAVFPGRSPLWAAGAAASAIGYASASLAYRSAGLEMPLALAFLTAALVAWRRGRGIVMAVLIGLAGLTSLDALLLAAPLIASYGLRERRWPWREALVIVVLVAPALAYAQYAYGFPVSEAYTTRIDLGDAGLFGGEPVYLTTLTDVLGDASVGLAFIAGLSGLALVLVAAYALAYAFEWVPGLWRVHEAPSGRSAVLAGALAVGVVLFVLPPLIAGIPPEAPDLLPLAWVAAALIPVGCVLGVRLGMALDDRAGPICLVMAVVVAAVLPIANLTTLGEIPRRPDPGALDALAWLAANAEREGCSIGTAEPGLAGRALDCRIVDPLGLATEGNAERLAAGDTSGWIAAAEPGHIVTLASLAPYEQGVLGAVLEGSYEIVQVPGLASRRIYRATGTTAAATGSLLGTDIGAGSVGLNERIYAVGGEPRPALFMHAAQEHVIDLTIADGSRFEAYLGIADGAQRSRGVTFIVTLVTPAGETELLREVVRPGRWLPVTVDLPASGAASLRLATAAAPGGTTDYGWAVWGEPRVTAE